MPEMDGLTATRMIRQWEKDRGRTPTPIVALSASALEEDVQRAAEAGCDLHVSKPVKKSVMLETIRNVALLRAADVRTLLPKVSRPMPPPRPFRKPARLQATWCTRAIR